MDLSNFHLDHVAIAVENLNESIRVYEDLGLEFSAKREVVSEQKVTTAFAQIDQLSHIELLEPLNNEGPIAKFIEKKGPGIHHLCFRVKDISQKQDELTSKGYKFIYPTPQKGAGGCLVNFIHPKSSGGVLIEISQKVSG